MIVPSRVVEQHAAAKYRGFGGGHFDDFVMQ